MLNALAGLTLGEVLYGYRSRASWNDRFAHWEKPASVTEEGSIQRAKLNVESAIGSNSWLAHQSVAIEPQGSYFNNTNVRTEADLDLRAVHRLLKVDYGETVYVPAARTVLRYSDGGMTFQEIFDGMRTHLITDLRTRFGNKNVDPGKKAIRIHGITGSRADVDVVPCVGYRRVLWLAEPHNRYWTFEGIAILSTDNQWTVNYPEIHNANGIAKRSRTAHRFKRIVRIFKRLRADMAARGIFIGKIPSFLVECLVYMVEDAFFTVETDDRFDRARRIALRMQALLREKPAQLTEINGLKALFASSQAWTYGDARAFVDAVVAHLVIA
jgi:hypothetical protein